MPKHDSNKFTLRLTEETKNILNKIDKGSKTDFINSAIAAYYSNRIEAEKAFKITEEITDEKSFKTAVVQILGSIEKHIEKISYNFQNLYAGVSKTNQIEADIEKKKKLKNFIRRDIEF